MTPPSTPSSTPPSADAAAEALASLMALCDPQTDRELREQKDAWMTIKSALSDAVKRTTEAETAAEHWLTKAHELQTDLAASETARRELVEQCAKIAEGELVFERYRTWPCWRRIENRGSASEAVKLTTAIARAIRAQETKE